MYKLGIETLPYRDFSLEVSLKEIADLGYEWVNLWASRDPLPSHITGEDDPKKVRDLLDKYHLKPSAISAFIMDIDETVKRIEFAGQLGIDTIVFHCAAAFDEFTTSFLPPVLAAAKKNGLKVAVENHITVPSEAGIEEAGVDTLAQINRLLTEIDDPSLGICVAPAHLWVLGETISQVITYLMERKKLFFYYAWDISSAYCRGKDGLDFGPAEEQLPRPDGTLDHSVLMKTLKQTGYDGVVSLCCHGTSGWPIEKINAELAKSTEYIKRCASY